MLMRSEVKALRPIDTYVEQHKADVDISPLVDVDADTRRLEWA